MRIAQVAPLVESVPPARYGGTERVVSYLTEELERGALPVQPDRPAGAWPIAGAHAARPGVVLGLEGADARGERAALQPDGLSHGDRVAS